MNSSSLSPMNGGALSRAVTVFTGLVLLAAAALKGHSLYYDPLAIDPLLGSRFGMVMAIVVEWSIGVWLLTAIQVHAATVVAALLFGAFGMVSLNRALEGEAECACFGRLSVTPWLMVVLDWSLCLALFSLPSPAEPTRRFSRGCIGIFLVVAGGVLAPLLLLGGEEPKLVLSSDQIKWGSLKRGEQRQEQVTVTNSGRNLITVDSVKTSCECLTARLSQQVVHPGQSVDLFLKFDSTREPEFIGNLRVTTEGLAADGEVLFKVAVSMQVQ